MLVLADIGWDDPRRLDTLLGYQGADYIRGGGGSDDIDGGSDNDVLYGEDGYDTLIGGHGDDWMDGGAQHDELGGGAGNDTLFGRDGLDTLVGGDGADYLYGGNGDDDLDGDADNDRLNGDAGNDILAGGLGDDYLNGGADHDRLWGQWGADDLFGGAGDDLLVGGSGADEMWGGTGADRFAYSYAWGGESTASARDVVRDFWRGESATLGEFASRLTGSSDLYETTGRRPHASINFVTAHDGFTLRDLVSYNEKHNEANGEDNNDGENHNRSWNCGVEGPTDDPAVLALRARQQRNFIATLLLSQGIPMLLGGDEIGRTQQGNNNAYCQDNEVSWFDWQKVDASLLEFTRRVVHLQARHPAFRRRRWFKGRPLRGSGVSDIAWFRPDGREMAEEDWQQPQMKSFAVFLNGDALRELDDEGRPIRDDSFLLLFNAHHEPLAFTLPAASFGRAWRVAIDTADLLNAAARPLEAEETIELRDRAMVVLER